jgi:hypothetical protein
LTDESFSILRKTLDGKETYVGSHQVIKTAGATQHASRMARVPVWALDDTKIKELIERCFPSPKQKKSALRMIRIIYLYYRVGSTAGHIAEELNMSVRAVEEVIRRINKTMDRPAKPRGRPKKNTVGIETANEVSF